MEFERIATPRYTEYRGLLMNDKLMQTHFCYRLKERMEEYGYDINSLADACKAKADEYGVRIMKTQLSDLIENYLEGVCCPKTDILYTLAEVLNVSVAWLCGYYEGNAESSRIIRIA